MQYPQIILNRHKLLSILEVLCLLLLTTIFANSIQAQTFRGTILGTVTDPETAVIGGASVTARNVDTGIERTTTTNETGNFSLPELPTGNYELRIERDGFQSALVKNILVEVASERRVDIVLSLGSVSQAIVVEATIPLVNTTSNQLGQIFESKKIERLPVNGRDFTKLLVISPGTTGDPSGVTDAPGSFGLFSVNGNRGRANNYLLDGTDMNDGYRNLPAINEAGVFGTPATILPLEAVSELAVISNFPPEYGRNSGAIVNIVTKSGTNEFHGSVLEFLRNDKLDARNFFNTKPNPQNAFRNNQFGFALGGPIVKNKTFFYFNYEGQRERVGVTGLARVPDPAEIAALGGVKNPIIAQILNRNPYPTPNIPVPLFDPSPNLSVAARASNDVNAATVKIDQSFSTRDLLSGRYYYGDSDQSFPLALVGGSKLPGFNTVTPTKVQIASLSYVKVISSTKVNELRFGYNRFKQNFFSEDNDFNPGAIGLNTGVTNPRDFGLPVIRIRQDPNLGSSIEPIGSNLSLPRGRIATNLQLIDNFSSKFVKHDLKFGVEFRRTFVNGFFDAGYRGRIDFASLSDFLAGRPSGGRSAMGDSQRGTFQNSVGFYFQDSFRIKPTVLINYGLRYDYFGVLGEERDRLSNFDSARGLVQVGKDIERLYERDLDNFAPRVGISWDINGKGKTVLRAGWGLFYDSFSQDFFVGQLPFNTFNPGPAYNPIGESPILFSFSATNQLTPGAPVFSDFTDSDVFAVDRRSRTPYVQNYNLTLQRELFKNVVVEIAYVGSQGRKLYRYRDINQPNPTVSLSRPFDNGPFAPSGGTFFYVNQLETTSISSYNSLQLSLSTRNLRGLTASVFYTYGHSIDNASDGQDYVPNASQPDDSNRPDLERASSNFDSRHRFVFNFNYELPTLSQRFKKLTSGWQVGGLVTLRSGNPFNVNLFDDFNGTGEFFPRPDLVGDPFAGTKGPDRFLNLSAFRVPCILNPNGSGSAADCLAGTQRFGTLGRNSLVGPDYKNFDFSVSKMTELTEKLKLEFRAEFYNIFNHPNFASPLVPNFAVDAGFNGIDPQTGRGIGFLPLTATPDVGIGNPFLGGGGPRNIQLGLKLLF